MPELSNSTAMRTPRPVAFEKNVSLKAMNTFGLDVRADRLVRIKTIAQLQSLISHGYLRDQPVVLLGGGSNVLFKGDVAALVLKIETKGIRVVKEDKRHIYLEAAAGEDWSMLVTHAVANGWGGIENLAGVPGTVGAAPVQNIACYGHNLHERLVCVDVVDLQSGAASRLNCSECRLGYRDSIFKHELRDRVAVSAIQLRLDKTPVLNTSYKSRYESVEQELARIADKPYQLRDVYQAILNIRGRKLPDITTVGSVGSVFKNPVVSRDDFLRIQALCPGIHHYPADQLSYAHLNSGTAEPPGEQVKIPAAWLIEDMGWAGKRVGSCGIWETQPINIVTYGDASPSELLEFIELVRAKVRGRYGVFLELEVNLI